MADMTERRPRALERLSRWEREALIIPLQSRARALDLLAKLLGVAVSGEALLPVFAILYWCLDQHKCFAGIWLVPVSEIANGVIKWLTRRARPAWVDTRVSLLSWSAEFSFPSSHSQIAAALSVWFVASSFHPQARTKVPVEYALAFAIAVGLSRIHQGLHYPSDVLVGLLIGGFSGLVHASYVVPSIPDLESMPLIERFTLLAIPTVVSIAALAISFSHVRNSKDPAQWKENACVSHFKKEVFDPRGIPLSSYMGMVGVLAGLCVGGTLKQYFPLSYPPNFRDSVLRAVCGNSGLLTVFEGVAAAITPDTPLHIRISLRFLKYLLVPMYILLIAPFLFRKLGI